MKRGRHQVLLGDCREAVKGIAPGTVQAIITSPPYHGLRNYGSAESDEIGREKTIEEYIANLVEVFRACRDCMTPTATLWLNLGDSYAGSGRGGYSAAASSGLQGSVDGQQQAPRSHRGKHERGSEQGLTNGRHRIQREPAGFHENAVASGAIGRLWVKPPEGYREGSVLNIPHRVAMALAVDGWIWRSTIIWSKKSPMPISVTGWRWVRCAIRTARSKRTREAKKHAPGQKAHGDRDGKAFDSKAKTTPCPGCAKCEPNGGYRLRKGKWRPTTSHEYIFLFSKNPDYYADGDAVQEMATGRGPGNKSHKGEQAYAAGDEKMRTKIGLAHTGARETRNPRDVWVIASENYSGKHFAAYPTALVKRCMEASTPTIGCCPHCRMPWSPIVETSRKPTRPGTNSKVDAMILDPDSPYWDHNGTIAGNRDPKRHSTVCEILGYRQSCNCPGQLYCSDCDLVIESHHEKAAVQSQQIAMPELQQTVGEEENSAGSSILLTTMLCSMDEGAAGHSLPGVQEAIPPEKSKDEMLRESVRGEMDRNAQEELSREIHRSEGLYCDSQAGSSARIESGLHNGTSPGDGSDDRKIAPKKRSRSSQKRNQKRQQAGESGADEQTAARPPAKSAPEGDRLPTLPKTNHAVKCCPKCQGNLIVRPLQPQNCLIFDPFAGSGTTLQTAVWYGRDALGCELNPDYLPLIEERVAKMPRCMIRELDREAKAERQRKQQEREADGMFAGMET